ncbi:MAG TPA: hypothetical protein DHM90_14875 [Clostridiaceae bacterium]|nr:hypothetical protein [Clostridiaceae bacterium]
MVKLKILMRNCQVHGSVEVTVSVDLPNAVEWMANVPLTEIFENGTFIEGFVTLEEATDSKPSLSIPYMGFYGEWDKAPVVDGNIYDETSFYGYTSLATYDSATDNLDFLGVKYQEDPEADTVANYENIAFSPNRDGSQDNVIPVLSFMRNAKDFEVNILDSQDNVVRKLYTENYLRKNYFDGGAASPYTTNLSWLWDGTVNGKTVQDGEYFYEVKTKIDFEGAAWQSLKFPVKLDTVKPALVKAVYDEETKILTVDASDDFSGIAYMAIVSGNMTPVLSEDGIFDLSVDTVPSKSQLVIVDYAGNMLALDFGKMLKDLNKGNPQGTPPQNPPTQNQPASPIQEPKKVTVGDTTAPVVMVTSPEFFGVLNSGNVTVTGYVTDDSPLDYLRINNQKVSYKWDNLQGAWLFSHTISLEDGYHSINIDAGDKAGNKLAFAHKIFVDTTKPVIEVSDTSLTTTLDKITLEALVTDNLPSLKVSLNSNMLVNIAPDWSYFDSLLSAQYNLSEEVALEMGVNTFTILALDDAGNETIKVVTIEKVNP